MSNTNLILKRQAYDSLYSLLSDHLSTDNLSIDVETAERPTSEWLIELHRLSGIDHEQIKVLGYIAFQDVAKYELPGNFVLPPGGDYLCQN